jgi:thymidylate synthase
MSNNLDKTYTSLLQDILDNGVEKKDRTGTGTLSVFGRQIRHNMKDGFPLLTTKKMAWKTMVTELLWFLRGDTNIKYLVDNGCHIWDGDAYKRYVKWVESSENQNNKNEIVKIPVSKEYFINKIKTDDEFAKKWGELGPIYGKQWRSWAKFNEKVYTKQVREVPEGGRFAETRNVNWVGGSEVAYIDQIANLINELKTNPDSRRLMVNAWNVGELDQMVLPPCHYGFQVYTRELSETDGLKKINLVVKYKGNNCKIISCHNANPELLILETPEGERIIYENQLDEPIDYSKFPTRAISLMWNQRSVDTFLGLPFNIASYGLLLMMIADEVNMVPDELIGNLGDVHLYSNHIEQAKEQIGRELTLEERSFIASSNHSEVSQNIKMFTGIDEDHTLHKHLDDVNIPTRTREPYPLPTVHVRDGIFCSSVNDVILENYQSHPTIKAPLSN